MVERGPIPMVESGPTDQVGIKQDTENEILEKAHPLSGPLSLGCHLLTYCLEFLGSTEIDGVARNQGLVSAVISDIAKAWLPRCYTSFSASSTA